MAELTKVKLKQAAPKITDPANPVKSSIHKETKKARGISTPAAVASPGPVINQLSDSVRETFETGRPMEDSPDLQLCTLCKRSFLASALNDHIKKCNGTEKKVKVKKNKVLEKETKAKTEKVALSAAVVGDDDEDAGGDDEDGDADVDMTEGKGTIALKKGKKSAGKAAVGAVTKGKKRKAEGESEKAPKAKKKKEEAKPKVPKPKGPVDVERQCGVITPNGAPCARSLTCKSHPMGLKRSVPGRSRPYDTLLAAYQKKNQAKQQKAALDANAPLHDSDEDAGAIDSDEETAAVLAGTKNFHPKPFIPLPPIQEAKPIKDVVRSLRIQQQLQETLTAEGNIFAVKRWGCVGVPGHPGWDGEGCENADELRAAYKGPGSLGYQGPMPTDGLGDVSMIEPVGMDFSAVEEACQRVEKEGLLLKALWD